MSARSTQPVSKNPITESNPVCRYFLIGSCRYGDLCRFSHDAMNGMNLTTKQSTEDIDDGSSISVTASISGSINENNNWVNAPIFVPQRKLSQPTCSSIHVNSDNYNDDLGAVAQFDKTWAEVVGKISTASNLTEDMLHLNMDSDKGPVSHLVDTMCPYDPCPFLENCVFGLHMEMCEMCGQCCLHPKNAEQRRNHNQECLAQHEKDMELSFAIARSKDKQCGICFEIIIEKSGREKRFGILPNCNHIFCLECIRKWRQAKSFEHAITRSCPECRVSSDFVCPSAFWVDTKEDKDELLTNYRAALGVKDCKYFKKGTGKCPFANKCFYKHALANGEFVDVGNPKRPRKARRSSNGFVDLLDIYLWEFVSQRGDFNVIDLLSDASDDTNDFEYYDDLLDCN